MTSKMLQVTYCIYMDRNAHVDTVVIFLLMLLYNRLKNEKDPNKTLHVNATSHNYEKVNLFCFKYYDNIVK
jgi:hypothetical protein